MATSSRSSTDTATLSGQTIQYSEPVMGPSLCASITIKQTGAIRRTIPYVSGNMSRFSFPKSPLWRGFWYPEDEEVGDDNRRGEEVESCEQAIAVCHQSGE